MKKPATRNKVVRSVNGQILMNTVKGRSAFSTVNFGAVSVQAVLPDEGELRRNIKSGQAALARAVHKLVKPGIAFKSAGSVPLFRADPDNPSRLIREVNGKVSTGTFINGKFKTLNTKR